jgi:hypothetical protein
VHGRRFLVVLAVTTAWGGGAACSGAPPAGPNEGCFRALDCREGLVCVEGRCTTDITPIVPASEGAAPPSGASPDAGPPG